MGKTISYEEAAGLGLPTPKRTISYEEGAKIGLKPPKSKVENAVEGVTDGIALGANTMFGGLGPNIRAGIETANSALNPDWMEKQEGKPMPNEGESLVDFFRRRRGELNDHVDAMEKRSPTAGKLAAVGGTAAGMGMVGGVTGLDTLGQGVRGVGGLLQRLAGAGGTAGMFGGTKAAVDTSDMPLERAIPEIGKRTLIDTVLGAGGQLAGEAVGALGQMARGGLAKLKGGAANAARAERASLEGQAGKQAQEAVGGHMNLKDMGEHAGKSPTVVDPLEGMGKEMSDTVAGRHPIQRPYPRPRPHAGYPTELGNELEGMRVANAKAKIKDFQNNRIVVPSMGELQAKHLARAEQGASDAAKNAAAWLPVKAGLGAVGLGKLPGVSPVVGALLGLGAPGGGGVGAILKHPSALRAASKLKVWAPVISSIASKGGAGLGELLNSIMQKDPELQGLVNELEQKFGHRGLEE